MGRRGDKGSNKGTEEIVALGHSAQTEMIDMTCKGNSQGIREHL